MVTSFWAFVYEKPDAKSLRVSDVVAACRLKLLGKDKQFYHVALPDGREGYLPMVHALPLEKWRKTVKHDAQSIIATALSLSGVTYHWGGTSVKAVDCSGLVRTVLLMHDITLPRNASQQAKVVQNSELTILADPCPPVSDSSEALVASSSEVSKAPFPDASVDALSEPHVDASSEAFNASSEAFNASSEAPNASSDVSGASSEVASSVKESSSDDSSFAEKWGKHVSSSAIRRLLKEGDVSRANLFRDRPYTITGCVTHGFAEGRKMGFPTANLDTTGYPLLIPANGVYGVWVKIGCADAVMGKCEVPNLGGWPSEMPIPTMDDHNGWLPAMLNIGTRPTFDGSTTTIEANIFDFNDDIYGQPMTIAFCFRLRNEQRFDSVEALEEQLHKDRKEVERRMLFKGKKVKR